MNQLQVSAGYSRRPVRTSSPLVRGPGEGETQRPRLRVVDDSNLKNAARRRRTKFVMTFMAIVIVVSLFALAALHALLAQGQQRIDGVNKKVSEEQATYQLLRRQVAELESPQRVVDEAIGRLGMTEPTNVNYLTPPEGSASDPNAPASSSDSSSSKMSSWARTKPHLGAGS